MDKTVRRNVAVTVKTHMAVIFNMVTATVMMATPAVTVNHVRLSNFILMYRSDPPENWHLIVKKLPKT